MTKLRALCTYVLLKLAQLTCPKSGAAKGANLDIRKAADKVRFL